MATSQIEFGLSEIGVFEFGLEQGALAAATRFLFEGGSEALFGGVAKSNSAFFINSAKSATAFKGQTIHELQVDAEGGVASVDLESTSIRIGALTSNSRSDGFFNSGLINYGVLASRGTSNFEAVFIEPETLDIKGTAVVRWAGGWKLASEFNSKGESGFNLDKAVEAYALLRISLSGKSTSAFKSRSLANSLIKAESFGNFTIRAAAKAAAEWVAFGASTANLKGLTVRNSRVLSTASSGASVKGYAVSYGQLRSAGEAETSFKINGIEQSILNATSSASTLIRPGSPVLLEMPDAWDVVIRPYENREATWK